MEKVLDEYNKVNSEEACQEIAEKAFKNSKHPEIFLSKFKLIYDQLDSNTPPLFRLRNAFEIGCRTSPNLEFKQKCKEGLMNSVISITGPSLLPHNNEIHSYNNNYHHSLRNIVRGQTAGIKNHASWFPKDSEINSQPDSRVTSSTSSREDQISERQRKMKAVLKELKEEVDVRENHTPASPTTKP